MTRPLFFAYYYLWYRGFDERRWRTTNRDYPPALGFYRSDDPRVMRRHLRWARDYGLDGMLVEWFGTKGDDGCYSDDNLRMLREIIRDFPELAFAVFYDQAIRFGGLDFAEPRKREEFLEDMDRIAADNFAHPNYWRIGGRPAVVLYLTRAASSSYGRLLAEGRERMARSGGSEPFLIGDEIWWGRKSDNFDFLDAVTAFNLHSESQVDRVDGDVRAFAKRSSKLFGQMQKEAQARGLDVIPGIGHAYNDETVRSNMPLIPTNNPGELPRYREDVVACVREMSALFEGNLIAAEHGIAPLFINSFNEWPERTAVEPSAEIEAFNLLPDPGSGRLLRLPAPGFAYLEGIRQAKLELLAGLGAQALCVPLFHKEGTGEI